MRGYPWSTVLTLKATTVHEYLLCLVCDSHRSTFIKSATHACILAYNTHAQPEFVRPLMRYGTDIEGYYYTRNYLKILTYIA